MVQPTYSSVREAGAPVFTQGPAIEEERPAMITAARQEQIVAGEVTQNVVEIPTQEVVETVVEVPEVQVVEKVVEVPQIVQRTVEQIVEEVVQA